MHVIFKKNLHDVPFILRHSTGPYLVRNDTGKYLRGRDLGLEEEQEYVVWDTVSEGPALRHADGVAPAIEGAYTVNGIGCKTAFQLLKELCGTYTPEKTAEMTGVSADLIVRLAERIGRLEEATFVTHMGFTRTYHGDISLRALGTVATVTGNVMATFKGGHMPAVLNWKPFLKAVPDKPSYSRLGILQLYDAIISGKPYPVKAVWFSFINFLNQCAHSGKIEKEVFANLDFIVATELFMTPTARLCGYPAAGVQFSGVFRSGAAPLSLCPIPAKGHGASCTNHDRMPTLPQAWPNAWDLESTFAGGEEGFVDLLLDSKDPSMEGITREKLQAGAMAINAIPEMEEAFDIPFSTPSGKIEIYSEGLVEDGQALPFQLDPAGIAGPRQKNKISAGLHSGPQPFPDPLHVCQCGCTAGDEPGTGSGDQSPGCRTTRISAMATRWWCTTTGRVQSSRPRYPKASLQGWSTSCRAGGSTSSKRAASTT